MNAAERIRCVREIEQLEARLRSGERDIEGLLRGLVDWNCELKLIEEEESA